MGIAANSGAFDRPIPGKDRAHAALQPGMNRVLFLLTLSVLINYVDRSNLSIAAPLLKDELGISASQLGTLLSAFFWSYALMQIPAGWLVDRFDVKWVFAAGFFLWTAATGITSFLHGFTALLIIRIVLGLGESVSFPAYGKVLGTHFKEANRGFANAMIISGLALGPAFGMLVGGAAVARFGWRPFFFTLGIAGVAWLPFWVLWMPAREQKQVAADDGESGYLDIFCHRSAWGTCIGQSAINYFLYFLVTWLPFYLVRARHLTLNQMARAGALVFLMSALSSAVTGKLSDRWILGGASVSRVRKGFMFAGHVGIGVLFCLTVMTSGWIFYVMLALTGVFLGMSMCNSWAIPQILAGPRMVGRWVGVQNFVGNVFGASAPAITGVLLDRTGSFYWPFFISAAVAWIGAIGWYFVIGPLQEVDWATTGALAALVRRSRNTLVSWRKRPRSNFA
jgi:ACS family D-galactonate transporter-like MFS transporter